MAFAASILLYCRHENAVKQYTEMFDSESINAIVNVGGVLMITVVPFLFRKKIRAFCKTNGYVNYGKSVSYVKNGMLFSFALKKMSRSYTVEFGVAPLCMKIKDVTQGADYDINGLMKTKSVFDDCLSADELWSYVQNKIYPFFLSCYDAKSALSSLFKLEKEIEDNRLAYLSASKIPDRAAPFLDRFYSKDTVFFMAMKALDYSSMRMSLQYKEQHEKKKLLAFQEDCLRYSNEKKQKMYAYCLAAIQDQNDKCNVINLMQKQVELQNDDYFMRIIQDGEKESSDFLKTIRMWKNH